MKKLALNLPPIWPSPSDGRRLMIALSSERIPRYRKFDRSSHGYYTMVAPRILIGEDGDKVSEHVGQVIQELLSKKSGQIVIGLSGGSLPKFFVKGVQNLKDLSWSRVKFIFCDERLVPFDHADSTFKIYEETLIGKIEGVSKDNFVLIDPALPVDECAKDYQKKLLALESEDAAAAGGFLPKYDILLLGMGPDGHTCSLFPGHALLDEKSLIVAPISDSPKPPAERVTLTLPVLNNAKACVFVSTGDGKKELIHKIVDKGQDFPAGRVKPTQGELIWILDAPAASMLAKK